MKTPKQTNTEYIKKYNQETLHYPCRIPIFFNINAKLREEIAKKFASKTLKELHELVKQLKN